MAGGTTFHFVTEGPEAALDGHARRPATVTSPIAGGPTTLNAYLAAGLVNELRLHVAPITIGDGLRVFDRVAGTWRWCRPPAGRHRRSPTSPTGAGDRDRQPGNGRRQRSASTEAESLLSVLERNRRTFAWKTAGLDEKGLPRPRPQHDDARWPRQACGTGRGGLAGRQARRPEYGAPWDAVDFDADPDWEWRTGALDAPEELDAVWRHAVERSRELVAEVIEERGLDGPASFTWPDGRTPTVRACSWT